MGNSLCCKKDTTVQYNSELALQMDTNSQNDDNNINNRTFRRSSFWSKKNNEINNLKTEMGGDIVKYERDCFMSDFVKFMNMHYIQRVSSNENNDEVDSYDTFQLHNFMRSCSTEGGTFPILILNVFKMYIIFYLDL